MRKYTLVCADMAGTTVTDGGLVEDAAAAALDDTGPPNGTAAHHNAMAQVRDMMGQSKIEVFRAVLGSETTARAANSRFEQYVENRVHDGGVTPLPGATETLRRLRSDGTKVALTTGFAATTQQAIITALGWRELVDLAVCPDRQTRSRPMPDMILHALLRLRIDDVRRVAVIGDSVSDIYSGQRAGAGLVAGVTTGAHDANALREAGATHVLDGLSPLPDLLADSDRVAV